MRDAAGVPHVVECCQRDGFHTTLKRLERDLESCQKALNGYLEDKKRSFPRFYFVALHELLDILSKGSNPASIQGHMIKLFENVQRLQFHESMMKVCIA